MDGWDIQLRPDEDGEAGYWMEADNIPAATASFDAACEVAIMARSTNSANVIFRALRRLPAPNAGASGSEFAGVAARSILAELLRHVATGGDCLVDAA